MPARSNTARAMPDLSRGLLVLAVICLALSASIIWHYGGQMYFAVFHRPFQLPWAHQSGLYNAPQLPRFSVRPALASPQLARGASQTATLTVTADRDADAVVLVWVTSPANKQVFRSPSDTVRHFSRGVPQSFSFSFNTTAAMPAGTYRASAMVQSPDTQTDYSVQYNFDRFNVQ